jgi:hypothetical protein
VFPWLLRLQLQQQLRPFVASFSTSESAHNSSTGSTGIRGGGLSANDVSSNFSSRQRSRGSSRGSSSWTGDQSRGHAASGSKVRCCAVWKLRGCRFGLHASAMLPIVGGRFTCRIDP